MAAEERGKKKKEQVKYSGSVLWGLVVCLISSGIYLSCYGVFHNQALQIRQEYDSCPLAEQYTTDWLVESAYVLYRDLRNKSATEPLGYRELYVQVKEGCEWVLDKEWELWYLYGSEGEITLDEMSGESRPPVDSGRVYTYLGLLDRYFADLEGFFPILNANFGYRLEDLTTGVSVGNLSEDEMRPEDQFFYLSLLFDANGNCTVEQAACGDWTTEMRKMASQSARQIRLENSENYRELNGEASIGMDSYMTLGAPADCRVVYAISNAEWEQIQNAHWLQIRDLEYHIGDYGEYAEYAVSGATDCMVVLGLLVAAAAFVLPIPGLDRGKKEQGGAMRRLTYSPEFLALFFLIDMGYGSALAVRMLGGFMSGTDAVTLSRYLRFMTKGLIRMELYVVNAAILFVLFGGFWCVGIRLREIRSLGIRGYVRERSLIYQIFPFVKAKASAFYDSIVHFDVTRKANRMIWKLVLINGAILFVISSLWMGGLTVALIYSVFLYIVLRRYISDLQAKYSVLLKAINEIAQGNPNVQIQEDLGVFEPFKPQLHRIQQGFRSAVNEEVKSQRMRAELITNVSHDLKTPLTAIITYIDLLKEEALTEEQRREYLDTLERKSLRLKALIEDLFEISKADSQNVSLNLMEVDLMNLVRQVAFEMGDKLAEQNLDLRMDLPEEKVVLSLDSQRTYRIYENLFGNIAKYAMPGTRVYVSGRVQADKVIVVLKNITAQEIAVSPQELAERFVRGDSSRNTEGSGLGLAIAKSFTQLQGGSLEIDVDGDLFKVTTMWNL